MPLSFEKENKEAYDIYLSVMSDPRTPKNLSIKDLLWLGKETCIKQNVGTNNPDLFLKDGDDRGYIWAKKNKKYMFRYSVIQNSFSLYGAFFLIIKCGCVVFKVLNY